LLIISSVTLAACGGGGGSSTPPVNVPPASLTIDSGNALSVSGESYNSAVQNVGMSDLVGSSGLISATPGNVSKVSRDQVAKVLANVVNKIPIEQTQQCAMDGMMTITGEIQNPLTITAGDFFSVLAEDCDDGLGEVIDGTLDFTVDRFSGDILTSLYDLEMTLTMMDFQVRTAEDVLTSNGGATVSLNTLGAPMVTASVTGDSMTIDTNSSSETLFDFVSTQTLDAGVIPSPYTWSASGTLDTTQLAGIVDYSTPVTFEGFDNDYPHSGELFIEGNNSTARLIAENSVDVTIEIDNDGNGSVDETIMTTWAELSDM
jgi:hypothetical protein